MLGSLSEFIDVSKKFRITSQINNQRQPIRFFSQEKPRNNSLLIYETQDKSIYLKSVHHKQYQKKKETHKMLKEALEVDAGARREPAQHWIEDKVFNNQRINAKNQLLRAIVKTRELENVDTKNTLYDKSFYRIISAYSKIKTQPIDTLLPPKMIEVDDIPKKLEQQSQLFKRNPHSIDASRLLQLQKSVKWAKKHGKNVNSFYNQLGKSSELIEHERPGKSNYQLQKQMKDKQEQQRRRSNRRKFLKQIERRISKYASYKQDLQNSKT